MREAGFTLLETVIALAIMVVAFTAILSVQSGSLRTAARARQMNVVAMLARNAMEEAEIAVEGKRFEEIDKEKGGAFPEPYADFSWRREIKEIEFPAMNMAAAGQGGEPGKEAQPNAQLEHFIKLVTNFLSKAVRELRVTVAWKTGTQEQTFTVTTYWVDLNHEFQLSL